MRVGPEGEVPPHHPNCFGCGPDNPAGLGLQMRVDGEGIRANLTLDARHEGAPGLAHGGVVAAVFDDLFGGMLVVLEAPAVTANLNVDFRSPVPLGEPLVLRASNTGADGRKLMFGATLEADGRLLAEATAVFVRVDLAHFKGTRAPIPEAWRRWGTAPRPPMHGSAQARDRA
ncbi:PaaI family thioesterase [Conexibacter sp. DBS9H8]|uniref:PaaI family thioesterase n=1 Tax=Conexibacter sp. DBS9H8 TaxID=2937801 RepID=UPI00200EC773|nr:PaaI family thioesterase [Conexibacter sp. DBS9H8]